MEKENVRLVAIGYDFEIVEKVPSDYSVWCIPDIADGQCAPFCKTVNPQDKDCFVVDTRTLKAVRLSREESKILKNTAHAGAGNLKEAKRLLRKKAKTASMKQRQNWAEKALPILERITMGKEPV